ncbi:MAG: alpha/beta fold hydrolase [Candidatus Acidiferrales bacterium]|jgi:thioesterase domain-containing protein/acyl carrier protein
MDSEVTPTTNVMAEPVAEVETNAFTHVQDATTRELVRIWQQLLGVGSVGIDQNYFDLGGDSVLAVHLFAEIEKVFKVKLPLATLFEAPTIQELGGILRSEAPSTGWSPLVTIQNSGSRPPFFCVHGAGGNVLIYRELSENLGSDQPFYGLQSQGLDGSCPPLTRIEDMAALYVKAIRRQQPHGPYLLGGYCGGGLIAFEIAQQLGSDGEEVALLALLDTMNFSKIPPFSVWSRADYSCERVWFHAANFMRLDFKGKTSFFREKIQVLRNRLPVWWGMLLGKFEKNSKASNSGSRILGNIWLANDLACQKYVPKPFAGVVTDFRPLKQYRAFDKPDTKWDRLALHGQTVVVLPVYPAGMLLEPFVKHLAVALRKAIDGAIRK